MRWNKFARLILSKFNVKVKGAEYQMNCPVCGDTKRHFSWNLEIGVCNCFRCGYRPRMVDFLRAYFPELTEDQIKEIVKEGFSRTETTSEKNSIETIKEVYSRNVHLPTEGKVVPILEYLKYGRFSEIVATWLREQSLCYLVTDKIVWEVGRTVRLLVECWNADRSCRIYWLARSMLLFDEPRYLYPKGVSKAGVVYGLDSFVEYDHGVILCEGWKDAEVVRGLALLGNQVDMLHIKLFEQIIKERKLTRIWLLFDKDAVKVVLRQVLKIIRSIPDIQIFVGVLQQLKDPGEALKYWDGKDRQELLRIVLNDVVWFPIFQNGRSNFASLLEHCYT